MTPLESVKVAPDTKIDTVPGLAAEPRNRLTSGLTHCVAVENIAGLPTLLPCVMTIAGLSPPGLTSGSAVSLIAVGIIGAYSESTLTLY